MFTIHINKLYHIALYPKRGTAETQRAGPILSFRGPKRTLKMEPSLFIFTQNYDI